MTKLRVRKRIQNKSNKDSHKNNAGMSLVEILIAIALSALFVFPMISFLYSIQPQFLSKKLGFNAVTSATTNATTNTTTAYSTIYWHDKFLSIGRLESGQQFSIPLSASQMNEVKGKVSCRDFNWQNIGSIEYMTGGEAGISSTTIPTQIRLLSDELILGVNSSSTTEPDLIVLKLPSVSVSTSTPQSKPTFLRSLDTGPGVSDLQIQSFTAYVANTSVLGQAQAVDISNDNPSVIRTYVIPGSNSTTTPIARKVLAYGSLLFVGTEKSLLPEIAVFDIKTGAYVGYINTEYGINSLSIKNEKLVVLGPSDPEIEIFDVAPLKSQVDLLRQGQNPQPLRLQKVDAYDASGGSGNGRSIDFFEDHMLFGRSKGGQELMVLDLPIFRHEGDSSNNENDANNENNSNNSDNTESATTPAYASHKISASVDAVIADTSNRFNASDEYSTHVVVFTSDQAKELQVFSLEKSTLPFGNPGFKKIHEYDLPERVAGAVCSGKTIYIAIKDPFNPIAIIKSYD